MLLNMIIITDVVITFLSANIVTNYVSNFLCTLYRQVTMNPSSKQGCGSRLFGWIRSRFFGLTTTLLYCQA